MTVCCMLMRVCDILLFEEVYVVLRMLLAALERRVGMETVFSHAGQHGRH